MARYEGNFRGSRRGGPPRTGSRAGGLDPNFRGGEYWGGRTQERYEGQARYGWYRARHADELGGYGGFDGRSAPGDARFPRGNAAGYDAGFHRPRMIGRDNAPRYDRGYRRNVSSRPPGGVGW